LSGRDEGGEELGPLLLFTPLLYKPFKNSIMIGKLKTHQIAFKAVFRIHMFLGLPDPDPLVRGMDPDPSISKNKY
jgi:hypothetical protein